MFECFKSLFLDESDSLAAFAGNDARLAAATLLVEAAMVDGALDGDERGRIVTLLGEHFGLPETEADRLLAKASAVQERSNQLYPFAKVIVDKFEALQRIEVIEMLWEVVFANNRQHDFKASLVRRVAGLIFVSDHDSGAARQRAMARLGLAGPVA
jgi:uncharacterized tellurite resistance protein B-like protein